MTTEPSTMSPKSMAPRLMRLPEIPAWTMPVKGHEHGEGYSKRDDKSTPKVAEKEQEDRDNEQASLDQVSADGLDGASDKVGAVVKGFDAHAAGKRLLNGGEPLFHTVGNDAGILSNEHHGDADNNLSLAVLGSKALPNHGRKTHVTYVPHEYGGAARGDSDDDILDIGKACDETFAPNQRLLFRALQISASGVRIVSAEAGNEFRKRYPVAGQLVVIDLHFVGLELAAVRVDFDDAGHTPELR